MKTDADADTANKHTRTQQKTKRSKARAPTHALKIEYGLMLLLPATPVHTCFGVTTVAASTTSTATGLSEAKEEKQVEKSAETG